MEKKYRFKKGLKISREDALYLNRLTPSHLRYVLGKIIQDGELSGSQKKLKSKKLKAKEKNKEILEKYFLELKAEHPDRTDSILMRAASTKLVQIQANNKYEKLFIGILDSMEILYEYQKVFMNSRTYYVTDFYLPEYNVVCEIDGKVHDFQKSKVNDNTRTRVLISENKVTDVFRFYNEDVENRQSNVCDTLDSLLVNL